MKKLFSVLATFALASALAVAQSQTPAPGAQDQKKPGGSTEQSADRDAGKETTITGCLAQGDKAETFTVTGAGGRKVNVSGSADLQQNIGKTVKVTGTSSADGMTASKVEKVSDTCSSQ